MATKGPTRAKSEKGLRKVARHKVRDGIEQLILEGRIRPGEKLVQLQLSRMFDVSLGMIREALFELQGSGLIESFDNRGIFVRNLDAAAVREFYTVRELFEGLAARECCGKLKPKHAAELRKLANDIYELAIGGNQREKMLRDREFHTRIVQLSENQLLKSMSQQYRVLSKIVSTNTDPKQTRAGHLAIVNAIEDGDELRAERVARQHIRRVLKVIERKLATGGQDLVWAY
jgi:DNA-binding GntR family transcriptional regulator